MRNATLQQRSKQSNQIKTNNTIKLIFLINYSLDFKLGVVIQEPIFYESFSTMMLPYIIHTQPQLHL